MLVTAITRYKHGALYTALKNLGWSQMELSRRTGLSYSCISEIINMRRRPDPQQAEAIQQALGDAWEDFDMMEQWPETFRGFNAPMKIEQTADVPEALLIGDMARFADSLGLPAPEAILEIDIEVMGAALRKEMVKLPKNEEMTLRGLYLEGKTHQEVADELHLDSHYVRTLEVTALKHMRDPSKMSQLEEFKT